MEREVTNGHVSGKNISPFIIGNFSGEILESYSLYMKGTIPNFATGVKMGGENGRLTWMSSPPSKKRSF